MATATSNAEANLAQLEGWFSFEPFVRFDADESFHREYVDYETCLGLCQADPKCIYASSVDIYCYMASVLQ